MGEVTQMQQQMQDCADEAATPAQLLGTQVEQAVAQQESEFQSLQAQADSASEEAAALQDEFAAAGDKARTAQDEL